MRPLLVSTLVFLLAFSIQAQTSRISELAGQLQQNIGDFADRYAKEYFSRTNNNRDQTNNFLALQQAKLTAEILIVFVKNNRSSSELRDVAETLDERFNRFDSDSANRTQSDQIKKDIDELISELKKSNNSSDKKPDKNSEQLGKLHWQGTVDDEVNLIIRSNKVQAKTISGKEYDDAIFSFTSPLPEENVQIFVNKKDGRGTAKITQQPTAENNWTAIVQISDKSGGAREYSLEIYWTK